MMTDEMKLGIYSKAMRGVISKIASKFIKKKIERQVGVTLNELKVDTVEGRMRIHVDGDFDISLNDLRELLDSLDI